MFIIPPFPNSSANTLLSLFNENHSLPQPSYPATSGYNILVPDNDGVFFTLPSTTAHFDGYNFTDLADATDYGYGTLGHKWGTLDGGGSAIASDSLHGYVPSGVFAQYMPSPRNPTTNTVQGITATPNAAISPEGVMNAYTLRESALNENHRCSGPGINPISGSYGTFVVVYKPQGREWIRIEERLGGFVKYTYFNCVGPGFIGTKDSTHTASIYPINNGYYVCIISISTMVGNNNIQLQLVEGNGGSYTYQGDGVSGGDFYLWQVFNTQTLPHLTSSTGSDASQFGTRTPATKSMTAKVMKGRIKGYVYMQRSAANYVPGSSGIITTGGSDSFLKINSDKTFSIVGTGAFEVKSAVADWDKNQWLFFEALVDEVAGTAQVSVTNLATSTPYTGTESTSWPGFSSNTSVSVGVGGSTRSPVFGALKDFVITEEP